MPVPSSSAERTLSTMLASNLIDYHRLIDNIADQLAELGWEYPDLFAVRMALEESISNAIRHGNKEDPAKRVHVECRLSPVRFWSKIVDEGAGFNPSAVPDCCAPERLEVPGGRGLALIKAYMTNVQYNECGNCLTMEKRLDVRREAIGDADGDG
jgi:serine/threonine-protein kinase RsbW